MDEYEQMVKDEWMVNMRKEHPEKTIAELEEFYASEKQNWEKQNSDADIERCLKNNYLDLVQVAQLLSQTEECKSCNYYLYRETKSEKCEKCGYCLWEKLGLLNENDTKQGKLMEHNYFNLFRLMGLVFFKHYHDFVRVDEMRKQIEEDKNEIIRNGGSKSIAYMRIDNYKEWLAKNPRPSKASLARDMGLSTRQITRDLRALGLE